MAIGARKFAAMVAWVFVFQLLVGIFGGLLSLVLSRFLGLPAFNMEAALPGVFFFSLLIVGVGSVLGILPGTEKGMK